jgi:hypothetical protein
MIAIPSSSGSNSPKSVNWMDCPCKSGASSPSNPGKILTHQQGVTFQENNIFDRILLKKILLHEISKN